MNAKGMNNDVGLRTLAGWLAILSTVLSFGALALVLMAVRGDFNAVADPTLTLPAVKDQAVLFWWSWVLTAAYFLLWLGLVRYFWIWFGPRNTGLVGLFAMCGGAGLLAGAIGQLATGAVALTEATGYAAAAEATRQLRSEIYVAFFQAFDLGVTRLLMVPLVGVWLVGTSVYLRGERRILGWVTLALGVVSLAGAVGEALRIEGVGTALVSAYVFLAPLWALWVGIDALRSAPVPRS